MENINPVSQTYILKDRLGPNSFLNLCIVSKLVGFSVFLGAIDILGLRQVIIGLRNLESRSGRQIAFGEPLVVQIPSRYYPMRYFHRGHETGMLFKNFIVLHGSFHDL